MEIFNFVEDWINLVINPNDQRMKEKKWMSDESNQEIKERKWRYQRIRNCVTEREK